MRCQSAFLRDRCKNKKEWVDRKVLLYTIGQDPKHSCVQHEDRAKDWAKDWTAHSSAEIGTEN